MSFKYYQDPILGKGRAQVDTGSGGSGGSSYVGGDRINIGGGTISFVNSADIVNVTGTSVTLQPNTAYKIYATSQAITLNANPPAAGKWAYEGHLEIFTAVTGYVVTGSNVVLANALEPDAVNNCTVRFHDGIAIISVEDHVAGYIVVNGSTSGDGSLHYGISTSTNDYVAFDASLNGTVIPLAGAVAEGEKHVVGNGYSETVLTGSVNCGTSKFTVANLALSDVQVNGGIMTLGDAHIPSGSTVAVSGGGLAVERVTGAGETSVIDLGGTNVNVPHGSTASASGCVFSNGSSNVGGALNCSGSLVASNCTFSGNSASVRGGALGIYTSSTISGCTFVDNSANGRAYGNAVYVAYPTLDIVDCIFSAGQTIVLTNTGKVVLRGSNVIDGIGPVPSASSGTVTLTSGAILDLTGNTNATPIAPGGGITFEEGGATVYPSAGQASAYMLGGMTVPQIGNTNVIDLNSSCAVIPTGGTAYASGCTFTNGNDYWGGVTRVNNSGTHAVFDNCTFSGNAGQSENYNALGLTYFASAVISNCIFDATTKQGIYTLYANAILSGNNSIYCILGSGGSVTISSGASINLTSSINPGGGIQVVGGTCTVNGVTVESGTYTSIVSSGGSAVINQ